MSLDRTHRPVLADEVREWLRLERPSGLLVDSTLGEGGHSALLLSDNPSLRVIGVDVDPVMLERARVLLGDYAGRVEFIHRWFDDFWADYTGPAPDRILFDLGISTFHFEGSGRGFSFSGEEPLDMRLSEEGKSAAQLLQTESESELADMIFELGGERYSRRIARAICAARNAAPIETSGELAEIVRRAVPPAARRGRLHPATRTFQALRIAVNSELDRISRALTNALLRLSPDGGRLAVISFHSLEDRIVKWTFRGAAGMHVPHDQEVEGSTSRWNAPKFETGALSRESVQYRVLTKKPVVPDESEKRENAPSRSAKFRVIEKNRKSNGE